MEQGFTNEVYSKLKRRKRKRIWLRILSVMICVVVFWTTYMLILPAVTKETDSFCGISDHVHVLQCYSDPDADVETPDQWERTFADVELVGLHREDLLAIARTQLGYRESGQNYLVAEDGQTKHGYTRYGAWYGQIYDEWSATFASFCLNYARVPEVPHQASAHSWIGALDTRRMYVRAQDHLPQPGDILFVDRNDDGYADRVGIVESVAEDGTLTTIEGDCSDAVARVEYANDDPGLMGYGVIPEGKRQEADDTAASGKPPVTEQTIQATIYTDATLQQPSEDGTVIVITGMLPDGATARAYPVTLKEGALGGQEVLLVYDITIVDRDGTLIETAEGDKPFVVSIQPPGWTPKDDENYNVFYVPDEGEPELITSRSEQSAVSFETNHFSTYALTATGNNNTIYLNGTTGKDSNSGTSANAAVQTLEQALLLVKEGGTIYITGTVTVSDTQVWEMTNSVTIRRQSGFTGPLVTVTGGTLTLKNITINGGSGTPSTSNIATNTTYATGSAKAPLIVVESGAALHIGDGAVLEYNSNKPNTNSSGTTFTESGYIGLGGAVYSQGNVTMDGGTIRYCEALCGGGIYVESANTNRIVFNLSGGTITYNYARDIVPVPNSGHKSYHKNAGGGVYVGDYVTMNMSGGTISYNQTSREGGGVSLGWLNRNNGSAISSYITYFYMTGGTFTGNVATSTGGGLNITAGCSAELVAGTFTENTANGKEYQPGDSSKSWTVFSGGAIYLDAKQTDSRGNYAGVPGYAKIHRVLITNNSAGYYGGGIATCSTSSGTVNASVVMDGTLIYGNTASNGNEMYLQGNVSLVGNTMLGGGTYSWSKSGSYYDNSLTENSAGVQAGLPLATVIITDNYAGVDGGGIGCNGEIEIGGEPDTVSISITKVWNDDGTVPHPDSITVQVYKDGVPYGDPITIYPTVDASGKETWPTVYVDGLPEGSKYTIQEVEVPGFETTMTESDGNFTITNTPVGFSVVKKWVGDTAGDRPSSILVQLLQNGIAYGDPVELTAANGWKYMWLNLPEGYTYTAKELEVPDGYYVTDDGVLIDEDTWQITNTKSPLTSISVEKRWEGGDPTDSVTVYLLCNGVQIREAVLNAANNWFYKWEDLPVYGKSGETLVYTVREAKIKGYGTTIREATSADASSTWVPVNGLTADGTYLLVASNNALTVNGSSLAWTDVSALLSSGAAADSSQLWTYSGNKLRNGDGKYLYLSRSGSFSSTYTFSAGDSGSNITYTNSCLRATSGSTNRYFATLGNNGTASVSSNTSGATKFTLYQRSTNEGDWGEDHYIVTNTKLPAAITFRIVKYAVGSSKEPTLLAGAQLELYLVSDTGDVTIPGTDQTGTLIRSWITEGADGENGGYRIEDLFSGTYYLLEKAPPDGYKGLDEPIVFTVDAENGQVTVISAPYALELEDGSEIDLPIYNYAVYELPRTGGIGTIWYTLGGLLLMLTATVLLLYNKHYRREDYNSS